MLIRVMFYFDIFDTKSLLFFLLCDFMLFSSSTKREQSFLTSTRTNGDIVNSPVCITFVELIFYCIGSQYIVKYVDEYI